MDNNQEFLKHYGVLGMRWGKRKGSTSSSSSTNRKQNSKRRMSNKELQSRVKRLKLEEEFKKLDPSKKTQTDLAKIAKTVGTVAAISTAGLTIYKNIDAAVKIAKKVT